jgi:hypothetical protein
MAHSHSASSRRIRIAVKVLFSVVLAVSYTANGWASGQSPGGAQPPSPPPPTDVYVGAYLIRVPSLSLHEEQWTADAYIWFRWKGTLNPPPQDTFELCNASIEKREVTDSKKVKIRAGGIEEEYEYACIRIQAIVSSAWNVSRYPFDRHVLSLLIEDKNRDSSLIRYVADEGTSGIDDCCQVPGWKVGPMQVNSVIHKYPTNYGDPDQEPCYSRFSFDAPLVRRNCWMYAFKVLNGLYVAVLIGFLTLFVKPLRLDVRFAGGVGAAFAAIASQYVTAAALPEMGQLTLVDTLFTSGTAVIFLALVESTTAHHFAETGRHQLAKRLDRISALLLGGGYVAINAWLVW